MMKRVCLLVLPLLSIAACLDMSDQDSADGTSPQASVATFDVTNPSATSPTTNIRETNGSFSVGAPTLNFGDPVLETGSGRTFQIVSVTGGVHLAFNVDPSKCVAVQDDLFHVGVRSCTQTKALWTAGLGKDGHSCLFLNNEVGLFLSGHNDGSQFTVETSGASGAFQQFSFTASVFTLNCGF